MNKRISDKEIIDKFVNSYEFPVIDNYISKPYEETIIELDNEIKEQDKEIERLNNIIDEAVKKLEAFLGREYVITDEYFEGIIQLLLDDDEYIYTGYSAPDYEEFMESEKLKEGKE